MTKLYSAGLRGFYDPQVHSTDQIPSDAVEIPDSLWENLLTAQAGGKIIEPGPDGQPRAVDPDLSVIAQQRLTARNHLLTETDALVARHRDQVESGTETTLSTEGYRQLQVWRQSLRDLTKDPRFPNAPFPPRPDGV